MTLVEESKYISFLLKGTTLKFSRSELNALLLMVVKIVSWLVESDESTSFLGYSVFVPTKTPLLQVFGGISLWISCGIAESHVDCEFMWCEKEGVFVAICQIPLADWPRPLTITPISSWRWSFGDKVTTKHGKAKGTLKMKIGSKTLKSKNIIHGKRIAYQIQS